MEQKKSTKRLQVKIEELDFECKLFHSEYVKAKTEYYKNSTIENLRDFYFAVIFYQDALLKLKNATEEYLNSPENENIVQDWLLKRN